MSTTQETTNIIINIKANGIEARVLPLKTEITNINPFSGTRINWKNNQSDNLLLVVIFIK